MTVISYQLSVIRRQEAALFSPSPYTPHPTPHTPHPITPLPHHPITPSPHTLKIP
ncbi:hypothetical protein [Microcystis aeruginosa]